MMKRRKFANWNKEASPSKRKSTSTLNNADLFRKLFATMLIRCHWCQVVYLHLVRNVATILKSVARMWLSNTAIKFHIKLKRWNVPKGAIKLEDMVVRTKGLAAISFIGVACCN